MPWKEVDFGDRKKKGDEEGTESPEGKDHTDYSLVEGDSSIGRTLVSKARRSGFESLSP
jgi:hypothetical protein